MKLYAQIGHGISDKVNIALNERLIDGAIFSPKDLKRSTMDEKIASIRDQYPSADIMIDPQFYVSLFANSPNINLGKITEWSFFEGHTKSQLEQESVTAKILADYYQEVRHSDITAIISPNILISQSLDSREAVISKNLIRQAKRIQIQSGDTRPLYASLIICREALQDQRDFIEFINDITMMDQPPEGIYVIIASRSSETRTDIFHADVIANWMMLNHSLSINGFDVINGYSDIISPFLGAAGGMAGATGWWSNLRLFSINRFFPSPGGRQPIIRYLSKCLLNRITFSEKDAISEFVPQIINELPHDSDYGEGNEPERIAEVLQSWESIKDITLKIAGNDVLSDVKYCQSLIHQAQEAYAEIATTGLPLDQKSNNDHLEPLEIGLNMFIERAELD